LRADSVGRGLAIVDDLANTKGHGVLIRVEELQLVALNLEGVQDVVLIEGRRSTVGRRVSVAKGARLNKTHGATRITIGAGAEGHVQGTEGIPVRALVELEVPGEDRVITRDEETELFIVVCGRSLLHASVGGSGGSEADPRDGWIGLGGGSATINSGDGPLVCSRSLVSSTGRGTLQSELIFTISAVNRELGVINRLFANIGDANKDFGHMGGGISLNANSLEHGTTARTIGARISRLVGGRA